MILLYKLRITWQVKVVKKTKSLIIHSRLTLTKTFFFKLKLLVVLEDMFTWVLINTATFEFLAGFFKFGKYQKNTQWKILDNLKEFYFGGNWFSENHTNCKGLKNYDLSWKFLNMQKLSQKQKKTFRKIKDTSMVALLNL